MPDAIDWGAITREDLEANAPTLVEAIKSTVKVDERKTEGEEPPKDEKKEPVLALTQDQLNEMVKKAVIDAQESVQAEHTKREDITKKVASVVDKSTLPDLTKARIKRQYATAESFDEAAVKESVEEAKKELAAFKPKITSMGMSNSSSGSDKKYLGRAHESVQAAFKIGLSPKKNDDKKEE
jgi:hypothetical protein